MTKHASNKQSRHLPAFLLLFLREEKLFGGQILERLQRKMPKSMQIDGGSVYRVLRNLEKEGFVSSEWIMGGDSHPIRMYQINESGLLELEKWYQDIVDRKQMLEFFIETYTKKKGDSIE